MNGQSADKTVTELLLTLRDRPYESSNESGDVSLRFTAFAPVSIVGVPAFDYAVLHPVTPMLNARYIFGSTCQFGCDTWLAPDDMLTWMSHPDVEKCHLSLRRHWMDSAPMSYPDSKLSLFGITEDVPDSLVYLVWCTDDEPEVWTYLGTEQNRFRTLADYLRWCVG